MFFLSQLTGNSTQKKFIGDITDDLQWPSKVKRAQIKHGRALFDLLRSLEVNKFGTIQKGVYDVLLVNNSKFVISHSFEDTGDQAKKFICPWEVTGETPTFWKS